MKWIEEAHKALEEIMFLYCLSSHEICAFLSTILVGQMERDGCSEEFAKKTFDRMFKKFKEIRKENEL